jgi:hypothetical protein
MANAWFDFVPRDEGRIVGGAPGLYGPSCPTTAEQASNAALGRKSSSGASSAQSTSSSRKVVGGLEPVTGFRQALYCLGIATFVGFSRCR